jgi:hypothetical protein
MGFVSLQGKIDDGLRAVVGFKIQIKLVWANA